MYLHRGRHRHVLYRWKGLVLTKRLDFLSFLFWAGGGPGGLKRLHSNIFDLLIFYKKKCGQSTFLQGGQHLKVARPVGGSLPLFLRRHLGAHPA